MKQIIKKCAIAAVVALGITLAPEALRTSEEAQLKIGKWEDCYLTPYYCAAGVSTVGLGSTGNVESRQYTNEEVAQRWVNDMQRAEKCVNLNFEGAHMPQRVFEATTDAAFNVGCSGLMWFTNKQGSKQRTTIWRNAQAHNWPGVCERVTDFVNSGNRKLPGLVNRRTDFRAWCESGLSENKP